MKITNSFYGTENIELRAVDDKNTMFGTVVAFDSLSVIIPGLGVREKVQKGAFTRTIKEHETVRYGIMIWIKCSGITGAVH